ncbi:serine hydrolase domain-containing protein [Streptomyces lichenis]|uniref:Beta-lactamase family protein n=1 Tax=Streptomyces lichenis TaxID=2306967 RepID=A0ABT0I681_9ACTN|nr:serine hydrolase domain-containing protein [Streptomyces lichenis]MCK8676812.1 beta-lactamase family protein [Streptomyces lichenis]
MSVHSARRAAPVALLTAALTAAALTTPAAAAGDQTPRTAEGDRGHQRTLAAARAVVEEGGAPGILVQVRDRRGTWNGSAGVADRTTGRERLPQDRFRAGSLTKTFVSTVVLQLEAEGRLDLDDRVERWLPGTVRGSGHDGRKITLRQLLNHTSGVHSYTEDPGFQEKYFGPGFLRHRYDTWTPKQLVSLAMAHTPAFAPGTSWGYSNTNYVLLGMVIEKATGRPYAQEVERRVLKPLKLKATSFPGTRTRLPQPSGRAYAHIPGDATLHDVTELNPSGAGAAGEVVTNTSDLQRFLRTLLRGGLLPRAQMEELTTTVPMTGAPEGYRYGLGIYAQKLSCGKEVWGHSGGIHGSGSDMVSTRDGRHSLTLNVNGDAGDPQTVVEAEFCG